MPFNFAKKKDNIKNFSGEKKISCRMIIITKVTACMRASRHVSAGPWEDLCCLVRDSHFTFVYAFLLSWTCYNNCIVFNIVPIVFQRYLCFYLMETCKILQPHDSTFTSGLLGYIASDILYLYMNDFPLTFSYNFSG